MRGRIGQRRGLPSTSNSTSPSPARAGGNLLNRDLGREEEQVRADVRQLLTKLNNVIPFVCLFLLKYVYAHAVGIVFFVAYSVLLLKLNHQFRLQVAMKGDQDQRMLVLVAATSLASIILAYFIHSQVERRGPLFMLLPAPPEHPDLEDVLWHILAADVCVRLLFTAFKAIVAILPLHPYLKISFTATSGTSSSCGIVDQALSSSSSASSHEGIGLLMSSPSTSPSISSSVLTDDGANSEGPSRTSPSASRLLMNKNERKSQTSIHTRKRRVYVFIEAMSLVIRSLLPVPAWLQYYSMDRTYGALFVFMYMTMKCMVLSRYCKNAYATFRTMLHNSLLEFGRVANREEFQEAGASDCSICLEPLPDDHSVVLPCLHFFCEECVSEWLEREKNCPVCRANVVANAEGGPCRSRNGSTSSWPCIL